MPDGYGVPTTDEGMLPWSWAVERLEKARNFWFATVRPDGRPHSRPAWAAWLDGALYFEGSPLTQRARNLAKNPYVVVNLESGDEVVIIEGEAQDASPPPPEVAKRLSEIFSSKFGKSHDYRPEPSQWDDGGLWRLRPKVAYAWSDFPATVTRWDFY
jgi:nitroimidazol reductase NimA-like FMN-containing flavoprotein (pyridoxamine 5'-phosphate oxidase superfamily)